LHGAEAEAIAQEVRGARQLFEFGAAFRGEEIELLRAMRQAAQAYAQEADFAAMVTMLAKKILEGSERCRRQVALARRAFSRACRYRKPA